MELCSGNLKDIIERKPEVFNRKLGEPMDFREYFISCEIFREILECVQYLHELDPQIIHRDLKPANILITLKSSDGRHIKLGDFGLATIHDKSVHKFTKNKLTSCVGTPGYIAPEILAGKVYDHKCDIYSLAGDGTGAANQLKPDELTADQLRELSIMKNLKDNHVVEYNMSWTRDGFSYILMELCECDLNALINSMKGLTKCGDNVEPNHFEYFVSFSIFYEIAQGVHYIHSFKPHPIMHRDLKPSNILMDKNGVLKLADFGLAKVVEGSVTHTSEVGSAFYRAPEVGKGLRSHYKQSADMYSLVYPNQV
ncbi:unnamed protein product [Oppiella nova]|uniref:Protein kinase domain-containing protein n=1 Tax=Oppiella nova TaxID=334625 RepID=A0A7R9LY12_9ACAR|nr:unnamed protein product [Oppiella nova]CAG2168104.1 unnamed protein product [Oppiella nova]